MTWAKLTLWIGAGYVAGLPLTLLSIVWIPIDFLLTAIQQIPVNNWRHELPRNDEIAAIDKEVAATLAKMQAGATLCQNLFCGFLVLVLLNSTGAFPVPTVDAHGSACRWIMMLILGISAIFRTAVYLDRQDRLDKLLVRSPVART